MKYLKLYENFNDIDSICEKYGITNYTINDDDSIDVEGSVYLTGRGLKELPLKFRNIKGSFFCDDNKLTSLEGCPLSVRGDFFCHFNKLIILEGCPEYIGGAFDCNNNNITSLEGCPESIGEIRVGGYFDCSHNQLITLKFAPRKVGGSFDCRSNLIRDLDDMYQYTNIKGFYCKGNPIYEVWKLFEDIDAIELLIDYDIFRNNGESIVLIRLNAFLEHINKPTVQLVNGYKII